MGPKWVMGRKWVMGLKWEDWGGKMMMMCRDSNLQTCLM